ncbi:MAG: tetratricopeptide repeat protein [Bacteroidales bacterium]|nr:tetratricopeptide repeat protein [Bacteroidales bacterium]
MHTEQPKNQKKNRIPNHKALVVILILSGVLCYTSFAQSSQLMIDERYNQVCEAMMSLRMNEAAELIEEIRHAQPQSLTLSMLEYYGQFVRTFVSEDQNELRLMQELRKKLLTSLQSISNNDPLKRWALANVYLQNAFVQFKFNEHYTASKEMRKAYFLLQDNIQLFPDCMYNHLPYGLLQIAVGSTPPQFQWVLKLVAMEGDVETGRNILFKLLDQVDNDTSKSCLRAETLFFLSFIQVHFQSDKNVSRKLVSYFREDDKRNALLVYARANLEMRTGMNDRARKTLMSYPRDSTCLPFYYLDYLWAETCLRHLDLKEAEKGYRKYLLSFEGSNYKRDAMRKLAWIAYLEGDMQKYRHRMDEITRLPASKIEADQQATKEAIQYDPLPVPLLKARLLFDGGYLVRAKALLVSLIPSPATYNPLDELALYYQLARVEHELGNLDKALVYYKKTIEAGSHQPPYYAAASALRAGDIYQTQGHTEKAAEYFNLCIKIKPEEYRQGLHFQAKTRLYRLKK